MFPHEGRAFNNSVKSIMTGGPLHPGDCIIVSLHLCSLPIVHHHPFPVSIQFMLTLQAEPASRPSLGSHFKALCNSSTCSHVQSTRAGEPVPIFLARWSVSSRLSSRTYLVRWEVKLDCVPHRSGRRKHGLAKLHSHEGDRPSPNCNSRPLADNPSVSADDFPASIENF